ncbi:MAG: sigma-24 (FecI-like) [Anaeromyxobacteraceae bacterium]|jgi:RNA polymerase sigma-70 factor (ECF subfamily)|nr:sigma-24 (FecI-like) [Anaeromyxobacteraceae bacterium]
MGQFPGGGNENRQTEVTALYRDFGPVVYRRCLRLLGDRAAAQDATQEVFVKLLGNMERLQERETVLPWIYRVATNHCLNLLRDARRRGEEAETENPQALVAADGLARPDAFLDWELARSVLSRFDGDTQAVAVGVFVDGMNHDEVADALGISRRTVSRKLERFVEGARRFLGVEGALPPVRGKSIDSANDGRGLLARSHHS